jgi:hypothetical protein
MMHQAGILYNILIAMSLRCIWQKDYLSADTHADSHCTTVNEAAVQKKSNRKRGVRYPPESLEESSNWTLRSFVT